MMIPLLLLLTTAQVATSGPPLSPQPKAPVVQRTGDATVLGAIGAADANAIEATTLAGTKASAGSVRSLAAIALHDHQHSLTEGAAIATQERITRLLPNDSAMARRQVQAMETLNTLSGAAFDRAFVQWLVDDHRALLGTDQRMLTSEATRPRVKRFLRDRLPMLRKHLLAGETWLAANPVVVKGAAR